MKEKFLTFLLGRKCVCGYRHGHGYWEELHYDICASTERIKILTIEKRERENNSRIPKSLYDLVN